MSEPADPPDNLPPGVTIGWDGRLRGPRGALYDPKEAQAQYVATRAAKRRLKRAMEVNGRTPEQLREEAVQARLDNIVPVVDPRFAAPIPIGTGHQGIHPLNPSLRIPIRLTEVGNMAVKNTPLDDLYNNLARYINDPLGFVLWAFPWGEPGTSMEEMTGPEPWQREQLTRIGQRLTEGGAEGAVIEEDTSAGHGVGKSALVSWLILWAISTHADTRGVVTANTDTQLRTKTWAELGKWYQLFIARQLFTLTATAIYIAGDKEREKTWRIDQIPWSKERSEAFAGLHNQGKRLLVIFDEACHDDKTEVLTKAGWKRFEDVTDLDEMLTMDPRTGVAEYRKPTKLFKAHRTGKMLAYEGRGASIKVTPNHKMWRRSPDGKGGVTPWKLTEAQALSKADHYMVRHIDWVKDDESTFVLPGFVGARKEWPARSFAMDDWMRFLGWYCSEGHVTTRGGYAFAIGVTQKDPAVLAEITALCERLGFAPKVYNDCTTPQVRVHDRGLAEWLLQWGKSCLDKRVPDCVRHASARHARVFIDTFTRGDGYVRTGSRSILYTSSKPLADGLQEVALKAGAISVIRPRALAGKEIDFGTHTARSSVDGWVVSVQWERSALTWKTKHVKEVDYDGMVYCAEVPPHHLLFTRRDGYCVWSGNSAIDDVIWEVTEGALTDAKTQIIWCRYGNPTKTSGAFFKKCTQPRRNTYTRVDSREVSFSNKKQIQAWVDEYGDDSDFVRVRVKGQFPRAGYANFISPELVMQARRRRLEAVIYQHHPKVLAVDPARFGDDFSVITLRQGLKVHWQVALSGFDGPDLASRIFEIVRKGGQMLKGDGVPPGNISCIVYDAIGNGADLDSALRRMQGLPPCIPVQWGQPAKDDKQYFNQRSECWGKMRDFLEHGQIPDDDDMANQLTSLDYGYDARFRIQLQSKKDLKKAGGKSPDKADSLALSFVPELIDRKVTLAKVRPVARRTVVWTR